MTRIGYAEAERECGERGSVKIVVSGVNWRELKTGGFFADQLRRQGKAGPPSLPRDVENMSTPFLILTPVKIRFR